MYASVSTWFCEYPVIATMNRARTEAESCIKASLNSFESCCRSVESADLLSDCAFRDFSKGIGKKIVPSKWQLLRKVEVIDLFLAACLLFSWFKSCCGRWGIWRRRCTDWCCALNSFFSYASKNMSFRHTYSRFRVANPKRYPQALQAMIRFELWMCGEWSAHMGNRHATSKLCCLSHSGGWAVQRMSDRRNAAVHLRALTSTKVVFSLRDKSESTGHCFDTNSATLRMFSFHWRMTRKKVCYMMLIHMQQQKQRKRPPTEPKHRKKNFFASFLLISRLVKSFARNRPCDGQDMYPGLVVPWREMS